MPNLQGRFLEGSSGTVRQFKAAGLPNITGYARGSANGGDHYGYFNVVSGAFSLYYYTSKSCDGGGSNSRYGGVSFDASKSNSIYGNSETVQPASYTVNYLIKAY